MPRIPEFFETLAKIGKLHAQKNEDYAQETDPFSNFKFTEYVFSLFPNDRDKSFVWPIATKLARLSVLLSQAQKPNFESIEDSFDDIATYVILWKCAYMRATQPDKQATEKQRVAYENQTNDPNAGLNTGLGRLNYAGKSDERKSSGLSDLSPAKRGAAEAYRQYPPGPDKDRE